MGSNSAFGSHKRRICQNAGKIVVPPVQRGKGVIFIDMGLPDVVQKHVYPGNAHHIRSDVIAINAVGKV
jgi:hypothetical protein